ncbi:MAG: glycosyltransferase family 2 protein [Bdellovibrionota bacterium]
MNKIKEPAQESVQESAQQKIPISVVLISLNEQNNIQRALASVSWAQDIIVYDSGSTDQTLDIAKRMGANVIKGQWFGFGKTKKMAIEQARFDWVLSLDCDEEVSDSLQIEIRNKINILKPDCVYRIPRLSFYLGRPIKHGGWFPDYQARLFNKKLHNWNEAMVHEKVEAKNYENLVSCMNHYVFKNIEHQVQTNNRYSSLQAEVMFNEGKNFSWFHFFTKPMVKFIECYFLKLGFMDAWPGYIIAYSAGYSVFLKWAKLRELETRKL